MSGPSAERMLEAFKRQARPFLEFPPSNDFEWMFIAQHHRLPTRLLDWSTNALVALFFASDAAEQRKGDGIDECKRFHEDPFSDEGFAVFVIDPARINNETYGLPGPIDIAADANQWARFINPMESETNNLFPICVTAPHMTKRIRAQSGAFTLHGACIDPLDYYTALMPHITKIFIPFTSTKAIQASLQQVGITESFIYPELDTIARDIARMESSAYARSLDEYLCENTEPVGKKKPRVKRQ